MDIIDFAEKFIGMKLLEPQKQMLKMLSEMPREYFLMYGRRGFIYVVPRDKKTTTLQNHHQGMRATMGILDDACDLRKEDAE